MSIILANCSIDEARKYESRLIRPRRSVNKRGREVVIKDLVYLNVDHDDSSTESLSEVLQKGIGAADVVTIEDIDFLSGVQEIPEKYKGFVHLFVDYEDRTKAVQDSHEGVRVISRLPENTREYDIFELAGECEQYEGKLRFTGNTLLKVEGLKIGRFDEGDLPRLKDTPGVSVSTAFDGFEEAQLDELEGIEETSRPKAARSRRKPKSSGSISLVDLDEKPKSPPKPKKLTRSQLRVRLMANRGRN